MALFLVLAGLLAFVLVLAAGDELLRRLVSPETIDRWAIRIFDR